MRKSQLWIFLCLLVVAFTVPLWLPSYWVQSLVTAFALSLVAMSFILLAGYCGMVSFTQMSFYAVSAYIIGICSKDLNWPTFLVIPLALLGALLLSAIFGGIAIRSKGIYFLMMTLALSQLFAGLTLDWQSITHGYIGISGIIRPSIFGFSILKTNPRYFLSLIVTVICYLVLLRIVNSPFGLVLQGIRDNTKRMAALGFNTDLYRFLAIIISGFFAGVGGILGIYSTGAISPTTGDLSAAIMVLMAALIGGVYRLEGGIIGAVITVLLINFTKQYTNRYWIIIGVVFILVMIFLPNGLLGINLKALMSRKAGYKKN
jgi:branched-chain amino acid transport system permease protein